MTATPIPKTAPFREDEIELLNRVIASASPTQRAWLAGFLAGVESVTGAAQTVTPPRTAEPLTIVYASESGNSEKLAGDIAKQARKLGFKPVVLDMAELEVASLKDARRLVVIAATWGEGEPPSRAAQAYRELMGEHAPRLDGVDYGVLALGDTAYAEFCAVGKAIDARLAALGAKRAIERVDCDLDFAEPAARWIDGALRVLTPPDPSRGQVIEVDFGAKASTSPNAGLVEAEIIEHVNLNSSRSEKVTVHLALGFDGATPAYEPGDALDLYVENDPAYVDELLKLAGLPSDDRLRAEFTTSRDVSTLALKTLEAYAESTGHQSVKSLIADGRARDWIAGRQLIDLIATFPIALTAEQLRQLTRPLAPRAYSIASSRREVGEEAHLLVSAVRYESHGRVKGRRLQPRGGTISVAAACWSSSGRTNMSDCRRQTATSSWSVRVPALPLRAFIQERRATGANGRSWLFFGDRTFTHDSLTSSIGRRR